MNTTEQKRSIEIATTIRQQLLALGQIKVWSWGANTWRAIEDGLYFRVQGFKFKGEVMIILRANDTYTISFIKNRVVVQVYADVYFDDMVDLIDNEVEYTGENYINDVDNAVYKF